MEHFCSEHQLKYTCFKKGNDIWWSHKQGDKWCNENKTIPSKLPEIKTEAPKDIAKVSSKAIDVDTCKRRSVAFSYSKELVVVGVVELKDIFSYADKILDYIEK